MRKRLAVAVSCVPLILACAAVAAGPKGTATPPDFKTIVELRGAGPEVMGSAEMIAHKGRVLQITADSHELILIDPAERRVEIIDLDGARMARITFDRLDAEMDSLRRRLEANAEALDRKGGRAQRVAAAKGRDLLTPRWTPTFDARKNLLTMKNPTAEAEVIGVAEPDPARLELFRQAIEIIIKLGSIRNPDGIPPYTRLDAVSSLMVGHKMRPVDTDFLYRLAGPPLRYRWRYHFVPKLDAQDLSIHAKLDSYRAKAKLVYFDDFDSKTTEPTKP